MSDPCRACARAGIRVLAHFSPVLFHFCNEAASNEDVDVIHASIGSHSAPQLLPLHTRSLWAARVRGTDLAALFDPSGRVDITPQTSLRSGVVPVSSFIRRTTPGTIRPPVTTVLVLAALLAASHRNRTPRPAPLMATSSPVGFQFSGRTQGTGAVPPFTHHFSNPRAKPDKVLVAGSARPFLFAFSASLRSPLGGRGEPIMAAEIRPDVSMDFGSASRNKLSSTVVGRGTVQPAEGWPCSSKSGTAIPDGELV